MQPESLRIRMWARSMCSDRRGQPRYRIAESVTRWIRSSTKLLEWAVGRCPRWLLLQMAVWSIRRCNSVQLSLHEMTENVENAGDEDTGPERTEATSEIDGTGQMRRKQASWGSIPDKIASE